VGLWGCALYPRVRAGGTTTVTVLLHLSQELIGACRAPLRLRLIGPCAHADDGAVDAATTTGVVPVLGPVLADGASGLADVFEIGAAEVLVLLDVKPEVENVLGTFALEE
jgi:hypothetical protein